MSKPTRIGKFDGKAVYLTKNSLAIEEDYQYLREMNQDEIANFIHQKLGVKELIEV